MSEHASERRLCAAVKVVGTREAPCVLSPTVEAHGQWGVHRGEGLDGRPVQWMVDDASPIA